MTTTYMKDYKPEILWNKDDISYYLLGAFITDGSIRTKNGKYGTCSVTSCDYEWLVQIRNLLCPPKPIYEPSQNTYSVYFTNKDILKFFLENECIPNKSLVIKMPNVPSQYLPDFLRGCFDGDGCIHISNDKKRHNCEILSASKNFADAIYELCKQFNPRIYCSYDKYYKIRFNGIYAYHFLKWVYYANNKIVMLRKQEKANELFRYYDEFNLENMDEHSLRSNNQNTHKVTEEQVSAIKNMYLDGISVNELKNKYNVNKTTINNIISQRTWAHVLPIISLTKTEKYNLALDARLGPKIIKKFVCCRCNCEFQIEEREKRNRRGRGKKLFCSKLCRENKI